MLYPATIISTRHVLRNGLKWMQHAPSASTTSSKEMSRSERKTDPIVCWFPLSVLRVQIKWNRKNDSLMHLQTIIKCSIHPFEVHFCFEFYFTLRLLEICCIVILLMSVSVVIPLCYAKTKLAVAVVLYFSVKSVKERNGLTCLCIHLYYC